MSSLRCIRSLIVAWVLMVVLAASGRACSTFYLANGGRPVFGRNYDWMCDDALVTVNRRGVLKVALSFDRPAVWTSRFGSVTFNQYGREFPLGGMNEVGLVVEVMWLDEAAFPAPDDRPSVSPLQWVQYQLDTAATVTAVIASDASIRIQPMADARIHFLVGDRSGDCAAIEFIDGQMVVHQGAALTASVLTNDTYARSLRYAERQANGDGTLRSRGSLDRFACAAERVRRFEPTGPRAAVAFAFEALSAVAQGDFTKWTIVYDMAGGRIHLRTLAAPRARWIELDRLDFACDAPCRVLDINADLSGDVTGRLEPYSRAANRACVAVAFEETPLLSGAPAAMVEAIAAYPETTACAEKAIARPHNGRCAAKPFNEVQPMPPRDGFGPWQDAARMERIASCRYTLP